VLQGVCRLSLLKSLLPFRVALGKEVIDSAFLYALGIALVFIGVLIIVVAVVLLSVLGAKKGKIKGGGAIIIGPVPIIFGTDKKSLKTVLLLSLALTVLLVIAMVVYYLLLR
jgi:uncharacterized protein (TIGR00304 family)